MSLWRRKKFTLLLLLSNFFVIEPALNLFIEDILNVVYFYTISGAFEAILLILYLFTIEDREMLKKIYC
jgi:hypothetical protein